MYQIQVSNNNKSSLMRVIYLNKETQLYTTIHEYHISNLPTNQLSYYQNG